MRSLDFAILEAESEGNVNAIGDRGLSYMAYGPMQIRQPVCEDVNRKYGTSFSAKDMLGDVEVSLAVFWLYMSIYATKSRIGREVTDEDRARIWNGGPFGFNKKTTEAYWERVSSLMK